MFLAWLAGDITNSAEAAGTAAGKALVAAAVSSPPRYGNRISYLRARVMPSVWTGPARLAISFSR